MSANRTALVTGASRGIGGAIAVGLAKRGYDIIINDIPLQKDDAVKIAKQIEALGKQCLIAFADISDKAQVEEMAAKTLARFGQLDVLVNNAGILIPGEVDGLPESAWDSVMDINAKGAFMAIQAFLPSMKTRKYGRIVNIASIGGKHGAPAQAHYSASKAAVMGFTRVLAQEVATQGITANCVCPGIILSEMGKINLEDPALREEWRQKISMKRLGEPEDVVGTVAFFASDDASYITGQTLNVDGGIVFS